MIIACPACRTRYVVPDRAIGADGRTVRCAKCKHSWFQQGPKLEAREPPAVSAPDKTPQDPAERAPRSDGESTKATPARVSPEPPREEPAPEEPAPEKPAPEEPASAASAPVDEGAPPEAKGEEAARRARRDADPHDRAEARGDARPSLNHWRTDQFTVNSAPPPVRGARADGAAIEGAGDDRAHGDTDHTGEDAGAGDAPETPPLGAAPRTQDEEPVADWRQQFEQEEESGEFDSSPFDYSPPFSARRNPLKLWTIAGVIFAVLALATMAAVSRWGLPSWVPIERPVFAMAEPDLELSFPPEKQQRRTLPNGSEFFAANGTVTNTGRETVRVPSILVVMRDARNRIVYSWEVVPPRSRLAPGETMVIKEAITDIPPSAKYVEIGWKPE